MIRVGLTGSLGAGKSTVGDLFASWGAGRIDADRLARQAVEPGTEGLARISDTFGSDVITADGALDRTGHVPLCTPSDIVTTVPLRYWRPRRRPPGRTESEG